MLRRTKENKFSVLLRVIGFYGARPIQATRHLKNQIHYTEFTEKAQRSQRKCRRSLRVSTAQTNVDSIACHIFEVPKGHRRRGWMRAPATPAPGQII